MTLKVILISAPPAAGKDTAAHTILKAFPGTLHEKFAKPLRAAMCGLFGISDETLEWLKRDDYRIRQLMILLSEMGIKQNYYREWFGESCADRVQVQWAKADGDLNVIISDAGFDYEIEAFCGRVKEFDPDAMFELWNLSRPFCNYMNDSREETRMDTKYGANIWVRNFGTKDEFTENVKVLATQFFGE